MSPGWIISDGGTVSLTKSVMSVSTKPGQKATDLPPSGPQSLGGLLDGVRLARGDGQAVALLGQDLGEREADASRGSGDDGCAVGHVMGLSAVGERRI